MNLSSIRRYYDENTRLFLAFGSGHSVTSIHRAVWTDGARTLDEALDVTHRRILAEIQGPQIADLGCGVGAGLFHMLSQMPQPAFGLGLTISPVQAHLAQTAAVRLGLAEKALIAEGDFTAVPLESAKLDTIYSIEAFCHALDPAAYLREASRLLRPGGRLILVDDFCAERAISSTESNWLAAYRAGWYVPGVCKPSQATEWASAVGLRLRRSDDLSSFLRLRALPDVLARLLLRVGQKLPIRHTILPSMLGSMALQQSLKLGVVQYRFMVFEKL